MTGRVDNSGPSHEFSYSKTSNRDVLPLTRVVHVADPASHPAAFSINGGWLT